MNEISAFFEKGVQSIAIQGFGKHYNELKKWLTVDPTHRLVYLVEDESVIKNCPEITSHPQVRIAFWQEGVDNRIAYAQLKNDFYFIGNPQVHSVILQEVYAIQAYLADLWLYREQANFYCHLARINEYKASISLEENFPKLSFVICGAGPSLEGHFHDLSKKTNRITLASGTAMNILNESGIEADLGVAFDGKLSGARRLQSNSAFTTPFFIDLDSTAEGEKYLSGVKILTKQGHLVPWKESLLDALGIKDQLIQIGPCLTSTHYALEIATKLKAASIQLLGVDLAYTGGRHYAGKTTWLRDEDLEVPLEKRTDLIEVEGQRLVSRTFIMETALYTRYSFREVEAQEGSDIQLNKYFEELPFLRVPLEKIKELLIAWKIEIQNGGELLLQGYKERWHLKFGNQDWSAFCALVVEVHLKAIDEALYEIDNQINFPKTSFRKPVLPKIDGKLDGIVMLYYDNGQLKSEIEYASGKRNGLYRFYSREGKLLEQGHYKEGVPVGTYQQWDQNGRLELKIISHSNGLFDLTRWNERGDVIKEIKSGLLFDEEVKALNASLNQLFKELS